MKLKPLSSDDQDMFKYIYTDQEMMRLVGTTLSERKADKLFIQSLKEFDKAQPNYHFYTIVRNHDNQPVGIVGLFWNQKTRTCVEMGVMIHKQYFGRGYAYIAFKLLMQHIVDNENVSTVVVFCDKKNHSANRIAQALGYKKASFVSNDNKKQNKIKWEMTIE